MREFTDKAGRTWAVDVTPRTLRHVRVIAGLDLLDPDAGVGARLAQDPVLVAEVLMALVGEQADAAGLSAAEFLDGLDAPALARGRGAVYLSVCDFLNIDRLREDVQPVQVAAQVVAVMLRFDLVLGNGTPLGLAEVPPPDGLHARLRELMQTLRAVDPSKAEALFDDVETAERQILVHRQRWRRQRWHEANAADAKVGP